MLTTTALSDAKSRGVLRSRKARPEAQSACSGKERLPGYRCGEETLGQGGPCQRRTSNRPLHRWLCYPRATRRAGCSDESIGLEGIWRGMVSCRSAASSSSSPLTPAVHLSVARTAGSQATREIREWWSLPCQAHPPVPSDHTFTCSGLNE